MRWFFVSLLLLLLWIVLGGLFIAEPLCDETPATPVETTPVKTAPDYTFRVAAEGNTLGVADNGFYFPKNDQKPVMDAEMDSLMTNVAAYLRDNPDTQLSLIGDYGNQEENNSGYPNLGVARAVSMQEILMGLGVPEKQILVSGKDASPVEWDNNRLYNGVAFDISKVEASDYSDEELTISMSETQYVYFKISKQSVLISPKLKTFFEQVRLYTEAHPEAKIMITGHTDNTGNLKGNMRLGRKRAEFIEEYLKELGVEVPISTSSEGPNKPIADNDTSEGRAKNRRVEIKVIK